MYSSACIIIFGNHHYFYFFLVSVHFYVTHVSIFFTYLTAFFQGTLNLNHVFRNELLLFLNTTLSWYSKKESTDNPLIFQEFKFWAPEHGSIASSSTFPPILTKTSAFNNSSLAKAVQILNVNGEHLDLFDCRVDELVNSLNSTRVCLREINYCKIFFCVL